MRPPLSSPFACFADLKSQSALRAAITAAYRLPETDCLPPLLAEATLDGAQQAQVAIIARTFRKR